MSKPSTLRAKIKACPLEVAAHISELEKENKRLTVQLAKTRVKQATMINEVAALKRELKNIRPVVNVRLGIYRKEDEEK